MKYRFFKGIKPGLPFRFKKIRKPSVIEGYFSINGDFTDPEVKDIKKLIGIKPKYFKPHYNSIMIGFNKNKNGEPQACFYTHNKKEKAHHPGNTLNYFYVEIKLKKLYKYRIVLYDDLSRGVWGEILDYNTGEVLIGHILNHDPEKKYFLINPWYGGSYSSDNCFEVRASINKI